MFGLLGLRADFKKKVGLEQGHKRKERKQFMWIALKTQIKDKTSNVNAHAP